MHFEFEYAWCGLRRHVNIDNLAWIEKYNNLANDNGIVSYLYITWVIITL